MASTTTSKEEIRSVIKFCAVSGQTPADTLNQITKVYEDNSVCRTLVFDWHKRFREGRTSIEDNERSGRPVSKHSEQAVEEVRALLKGDRRYTLKDLALEFKNIFVKWCERWRKCIQCKGEYFEKE